MSDKDLVERPEDGPEDDREQTLVAHLIELRSRIVRHCRILSELRELRTGH